MLKIWRVQDSLLVRELPRSISFALFAQICFGLVRGEDGPLSRYFYLRLNRRRKAGRRRYEYDRGIF